MLRRLSLIAVVVAVAGCTPPWKQAYVRGENAIAAARGFAEEGRAALSTLPDSPGVTGLTAAADYLLESVEAAAS
jgi:hypothetical protein